MDVLSFDPLLIDVYKTSDHVVLMLVESTEPAVHD